MVAIKITVAIFVGVAVMLLICGLTAFGAAYYHWGVILPGACLLLLWSRLWPKFVFRWI